MTLEKRPWLSGNLANHSKFYGLWFGRKLSNAIYAPGVDRFIVLDNFDPWLTLTTARILSSKLPTMVLLLGSKIKHFDNTECLEWSVLNKKNLSINGSTVGRQFPGFVPLLEEDSVEKLGWPSDYSNLERKKILIDLQEYALFTLRTVYAVTIADAMRNDLPLYEILETVGLEHTLENLDLPYDYSKSNIGIKKNILKILYLSESIDEALKEIENLWISFGNDLTNYKDTFYYILGLEQSENLKNLEPDWDAFTRRAI